MNAGNSWKHHPFTNSLIDTIAETSHEGFIGMDSQGYITHWNTRAELIFGWRASDAIGCKLGELIVPPYLREAHQNSLNHYLASGVTKILNRRITLKAQNQEGDIFPVEITISAYSENGEQPMFFAFLKYIEEPSTGDSALLELVRTDSLTGLANRRFIREKLEEVMNRVQRTKRLLAVMFMDIDHFKSVNDRLGHDIGDLVLIEFGVRLKRSARKVDFVGRLGGDEFLVIAEEQENQESVSNLARKILQSMATEFLIADHRLHVTSSIGIALYEGQTIELDTLIRQADQAMYQAKKSGRNTFKFATDSSDYNLSQDSSISPLSSFLRKPQTEGFVQNSLHAIRKHLGMEVAFISQFINGNREFMFVDSESENPPIRPGDAGPLEDSYCQRVVDKRLPEIIPDAFLNEEALSLAATKAVPVRAHLSVPIFYSNGEIYGTYCCFSSSANQSLNERDRNMLRMFADLTVKELEKELH